MRLIRRIEPDITIWFHQPLALVDASGDVRLERRYARLAGLPLVRLPRLHGTATSWQKHTLGGTEAFVVELPGGALRPRAVKRYARAVYRLVDPRPAARNATWRIRPRWDAGPVGTRCAARRSSGPV